MVATGAAAQPQALTELLACYKRACKNCPWRGSFWAGRLRAVEFTWQATRAAAGASEEQPIGGAEVVTPSESSWAGHGQVYSEALQVCSLFLSHARSLSFTVSVSMWRRVAYAVAWGESYSPGPDLYTCMVPL